MRCSILAFSALVAGCSGSMSEPPPNTPKHYLCDEGHVCPVGQECLQAGAVYCCGGPPCGTEFYRAKCSAHSECRVDEKCEQGQCKTCEAIGCPEIVDGGVPDLTTPDMRDPFAWNASQPRGPAAGCANNQGWVLSAKLHACPGSCNSNMCPALCSSGWANPTTLSIPESACASVPWGFFASAAHGLETDWPASSLMQCTWEAINATWDQSLRLGCGPSGRVFNGAVGPRVYTQAAPQKCGGFPVVARCTGLSGASTADTPFSCDPPASPYREVYYGPPNLAIQVTASDGVLCAQP